MSTAAFRPDDVTAFHYVDRRFDVTTDRATGDTVGLLECDYALDDLAFTERFTLPVDGALATDAATVDAAFRLVHLLAGVSYYKAAAPPLVVVDEPITDAEAALLHAVYVDGLGEFAFRNGLDLTDVRIDAPRRDAVAAPTTSAGERPLIPFGGGVDSIVTVEGVRSAAPDAALFVVSREGDRFAAIEDAAAVTGLPVRRATRRLDDKILRSADFGFRNGHVPVTGIISAVAVAAAVLDGRDAVVMSNEWSASSGNVERDGRVVNHQWSKSLAFERLFRAALAESLAVPVDYFSWLRPFSELWVAQRFAALDAYVPVFRSCNRSFHIDPAVRMDRWCGRCDKCCFIDLILAPYVDAAALRAVFDGAEPLDDPALLPQFRTLVGTSGDIKPFECVGDVDECRVAVLVAARRADRAGNDVLGALAAELAPLVPGDPAEHLARLVAPLGEHEIPERYAPPDLLG